MTSEHQLLYNTLSLCPVCSFVDKKGVGKEQWKQASIVQDTNDKVLQIVSCEQHGTQTITVSSDINFFRKMLKYTPGVMDTTLDTVLDIEEIENRIRYKNTEFYNHPLIVDVEMFVPGGTEFLSDEVLLRDITRATAPIPPQKNYILRLNGKLTRELEKLNQKIKKVLERQRMFNENPVLLELSYDRISELSQLPDTVLLDNLVHPSIQVYVQHGQEDKDAEELERAFHTLRGINNMQVVLRLVISRPLPNLDRILRDIRYNMRGFTRFVVIEVERTPQQIMTHFRPQTEPVEMDPLDVIKLIETNTNGDIKMDDFYPASVGMVLEPFLNFMGMGKYSIRPSPWCGFATCLVNTGEGGLDSVPLPRLFDIDKLYNDMIPVLQTLQSKGDKLSFVMLRAIKKSVNQSMREEMKQVLPTDILGYAVDSDKRQMMNDTLHNLQFIIIHNLMDVASVDLVRRSRCSLCSNSGNGAVASCTKCV